MDAAVYAAADAGKPLLGICLGMQLLFERSFEYGEHRGLGLLKGEVVGMAGRIPAGLDIPQIGWNALRKTKDSAYSPTPRRARTSTLSTATSPKTAAIPSPP